MRPLYALCMVFFALCGCSQGQSGSHLPLADIAIVSASGTHPFHVEIAANDASRAHGLMERRELAPDAGMLFDYHRAQDVAFWMKNTPLPLDMIFIRADGTIASIVAFATPYSETPIPSVEPVRAVLEINGGRAAELGIKPNDKVLAAIFANLR